MRILSQRALVECPPGYGLSHHGTQCIKEERGQASPVCAPPDVLSPDGDSCLTTIQQGYEYVCPDGYQCVSHHLKQHHHKSPVCSACAKTTEALPTCGCPEGQTEVEGACYDEEEYASCQFRRSGPRKQAPPTKMTHGKAPPPTKGKEEAPICKALGPVSCTCEQGFNLECSNNFCTCINRELIPTVPVCNGEVDENGICLGQAKKRLLYQCAEGYTCDVVNHHGRCNCVRVLTAEPTTRCLVGELKGDKCIDVAQEPPVVGCPPGYEETCCEGLCSCTKTTLAMREVRCPEGAVNVNGECLYVSKPSAGCEEVRLHCRHISFTVF